MNSSASNHMFGIAYLFNSYDTEKYTQYKVSISDGNDLSILGSCSVNVPNGTLEDVFHVQVSHINFISIYCACRNVINLNLGLINMC